MNQKQKKRMSYRKILNVFTIIYKGKQKVGFKIEGMEMDLYLNPAYVQSITGVIINEIEILTGSFIKPIFYQVGDKMFSGKIFEKGSSQIVKSFQIKCDDTIENMRKKNSSQLQNLKEIKKVFHFSRNNNNIICFEIGAEKPVFVASNVVTRLTTIDLSEIHILEGSFIAPEFYKVGENIYEGMNNKPELCRKGGVILKNLNLRLLGEIDKMHERFENSTPQIGKSFNRTDYIYYDNNDSDYWLVEAAGTDDPEIMRDVYWNLD